MCNFAKCSLTISLRPGVSMFEKLNNAVSKKKCAVLLTSIFYPKNWCKNTYTRRGIASSSLPKKNGADKATMLLAWWRVTMRVCFLLLLSLLLLLRNINMLLLHYLRHLYMCVCSFMMMVQPNKHLALRFRVCSGSTACLLLTFETTQRAGATPFLSTLLIRTHTIRMQKTSHIQR